MQLRGRNRRSGRSRPLLPPHCLQRVRAHILMAAMRDGE